MKVSLHDAVLIQSQTSPALPSAWTFQPILSSQQARTLKSETHTFCAGLDPVCCHPGPEPRIRREKKSDRWKKGRGKKINEFLSWLKKLKLTISFQFKGTRLRTFLFILSCTSLTKQVFVSLSLLSEPTSDRYSGSLPIFPTGFIRGSTFEQPHSLVIGQTLTASANKRGSRLASSHLVKLLQH